MAELIENLRYYEFSVCESVYKSQHFFKYKGFDLCENGHKIILINHKD